MHAVEEIRSFNRFYTQRIGVLRDGLLDSPFTLTQARVLFELRAADGWTAGRLAKHLDLDPGYLSRTLAFLERKKLLSRRRSDTDGRQRILRLTASGRNAAADLDERARAEIVALLEPLSDPALRRTLEAMRTLRRELEQQRRDSATVVLRDPRPGEYGWVVTRHGALYATEYGWNVRFEALVAKIVADFASEHDATRERAWIADVDGEPVGSVFLVRHADDVAALRLLLVEPSARGLGIGSRLVDECIRFARDAGYAQLRLWTNDVLSDARRIYERAGFTLDSEERHRRFGPELTVQVWSMPLRNHRGASSDA